ncbi:unnamed protein product [Ixodes pacificus]
MGYFLLFFFIVAGYCQQRYCALDRSPLKHTCGVFCTGETHFWLEWSVVLWECSVALAYPMGRDKRAAGGVLQELPWCSLATACLWCNSDSPRCATGTWARRSASLSNGLLPGTRTLGCV